LLLLFLLFLSSLSPDSSSPFFLSFFALFLTHVRSGDELQNESVHRGSSVSSNSDLPAVEMADASFAWAKDAVSPTLSDVTFRCRQGQLVAVVGKVGSGKSSLVSALLGEMNKTSGKVNIRGKVAYVPQQAWIMNDTLKDNITFGKVSYLTSLFPPSSLSSSLLTIFFFFFFFFQL
jgi:ABC-type multidrug transport system fused ATPase/permease subunit